MANQNLPPAVINRLHRELREIFTNPDACIHVFPPNDDNLLVWKVAIFGPPDSVYQVFLFSCYLWNISVQDGTKSQVLCPV
ncbi:ubiquitin-conjugating enzyme domain-containing protein [Ditylenchus destructor]|uniref:Ubiquitin-conjugating enzyme domain-containing protein n=1 Tax=Ditylenchus destructor TaxID=166010 RepID=A0AAD4NBY2_9BILA|nr:ubiquitin-conjugating enzyme domain-containing protein [Ditylenchus destructor]